MNKQNLLSLEQCKRAHTAFFTVGDVKAGDLFYCQDSVVYKAALVII